MSAPPLILADNLFETVVLHPSFSLLNRNSDDAAGHDTGRIADNLRDLTWWTRTGTGSSGLAVDGQNATQPTMLVLDRGHNLAGTAVTIGGYTDTTFATLVGSVACTIPTTAGGLPTDASGCLTPDGVWWKTFALPAARVWNVAMAPTGSPIVTGLYLGAAYRIPEYLNTPFASDYGRDVKLLGNQLSRGGLRSVARRLVHRRVTLDVDLDGADYAPFDALLDALFTAGQPWWICLDDTDAVQAGRCAPFQVGQDTTYTPSRNPYHREIRNLVLEEVLPR